MSKLSEKISELADRVGVDREFGNLAIAEAAISIIENMEKIIEEAELLDWNDISISQPENNSIKLFKDKNGKRIIGKFRRTDHEWENKYWAVYDMLNFKLLHDSITHWKNISSEEDTE